MSDKASREMAYAILNANDFQSLFDAVAERGFRIFGPTVKDGAVICDQIGKVDDLPIGWADRQEAGSYRLVKNRKKTFFAHAVGPHTWKKYLHPPVDKLWEAKRDNGRVVIEGPEPESVKRALLGIRSCELHALAVQDTVFIKGPFVDYEYQRRRQNLLIVAVNCSHPGDTCFCASMKTGPRADSGFDLSLTEVLESRRHYFVVETGSAAGVELLSKLPVTEATAAKIEMSEKISRQAIKKMNRSLETNGLRELLYRKFDDPHWEQTAKRCLSCGNCTMVCPTCFCVTVEDSTDLTGQRAERRTKWDSCFTTDFSYIHGGSIRYSGRARYRQWMMHKLAYWVDQFGTSGCVGCGRCITWCPAGIDITEEARAIQEKE